METKGEGWTAEKRRSVVKDGIRREERHLMGFRWDLVLDLPADRIVYHFSFSLVNVASRYLPTDLRVRDVFLKSIRLRFSTSKHILTSQPLFLSRSKYSTW